jgi:hypothetical protein
MCADEPPLKQHHSVLTFGTSSSHVTICQMGGLGAMFSSEGCTPISTLAGEIVKEG